MRILFLDLDTLRPDHLGCYGYHRHTSPSIDRIAADGVRFDGYHCSDAPCLPSRAALVSGRFGIHTGVVGHGGTAADMRLERRNRGFADRLRHESLWSVVRSSGLHTVTISPFAERHGAWWFYAGLNEMHNTGGYGMESAEEITPAVLDWVARNAQREDWLLHVNYWDPHTPYRAPKSFGNPFSDAPLPAWLTEEVLVKHRNAIGPHTAREIAMYDSEVNPRYPRQSGELEDMHDLRQMIDGYDCGIRYMDDHIGRVLSALEEQGVLDDMGIIITSDHGENMGELGIYGEHATADAITARIPMIVRWPGGLRGHVDEDLHYGLDLAPTLAELLGRPAAESWDGSSHAATILSGESCGRDSLVLSQCAHVCQRAVRTGPWMYVRTYHDGYHLFPEEMLFDVDNDPHEQCNLAPLRPDVCHETAHQLAEWHAEMMATMLDGYDTDPLWTVMKEGGPEHARGQLRRYCERLAQTDRTWAIPELKRRHPQEFTDD